MCVKRTAKCNYITHYLKDIKDNTLEAILMHFFDTTNQSKKLGGGSHAFRMRGRMRGRMR